MVSPLLLTAFTWPAETWSTNTVYDSTCTFVDGVTNDARIQLNANAPTMMMIQRVRLFGGRSPSAPAGFGAPSTRHGVRGASPEALFSPVALLAGRHSNLLNAT